MASPTWPGRGGSRTESDRVAPCVSDGLVVAVDLSPLRPVFEPPGVKFIQGDITTAETFDRIRDMLQERQPNRTRDSLKVDAVISDMAPHSSGIEASDRVKQIVGFCGFSGDGPADRACSAGFGSQELCYAALSVARKLLKIGGTFVCKVFVGGEENSEFDLLEVVSLGATEWHRICAKPHWTAFQSSGMYCWITFIPLR